MDIGFILDGSSLLYMYQPHTCRLPAYEYHPCLHTHISDSNLPSFTLHPGVMKISVPGTFSLIHSNKEITS